VGRGEDINANALPQTLVHFYSAMTLATTCDSLAPFVYLILPAMLGPGGMEEEATPGSVLWF